MSKRTISLIKMFVLTLFTSSVVSQCVDSFSHTGQVCDYSTFTVYSTPNLYCDAFGGLDDGLVIDYCKVSNCSFCDPDELAGCKGEVTLLGKDLTVLMEYKAEVAEPNITPYQGACSMKVAEACYRRTLYANDPGSEPLWDHHTQGSGVPPNETPDCCLFECYEKFDFSRQGCGTDNNYYFGAKAFCTAYCSNRQLDFFECFTENCGEAFKEVKLSI